MLSWRVTTAGYGVNIIHPEETGDEECLMYFFLVLYLNVYYINLMNDKRV